MRYLPSTFLAAALALSAPPLARADVLYDEEPNLTAGQTGDCAYGTTCGPDFAGVGSSTYAAQQFSFASDETVNQIDWNSVVSGSTATAANWAFYADNAGTPGALVASGSDLSLVAPAGPIGSQNPTIEYSITIDPVALTAGTYYVAIQAVTTNFNDFLSQGVDSSGAFETTDGGTTWNVGYGAGGLEVSSIAVTLEGVGVPEPASLALFGLGLSGLGVLRRRRRA